MAFSILVGTGFIDYTPTASSEASGWTDDNLKDYTHLRRAWKSTSTSTSVSIDLDFASAQSPDFLFVDDANFSGITIRGATSTSMTSTSWALQSTLVRDVRTNRYKGFIQIKNISAIQSDFMPAMTSAISFGYEISADSTYSDSYKAYMAFDDDIASKSWYAGTPPPNWIQVFFGSAKTVTSYSIYCSIVGRYPLSWDLQGSSNASTWAILDSRSITVPDILPNAWNSYVVSSPSSFAYCRLYINSNSDSALSVITEIKFYETIYPSDFNFRYARIIPSENNDSSTYYRIGRVVAIGSTVTISPQEFSVSAEEPEVGINAFRSGGDEIISNSTVKRAEIKIGFNAVSNTAETNIWAVDNISPSTHAVIYEYGRDDISRAYLCRKTAAITLSEEANYPDIVKGADYIFREVI